MKVNGIEGDLFFHTGLRTAPNYSVKCTTGNDGKLECPKQDSCSAESQCHSSTGPNGEVFLIKRHSVEIDGFNHPLITLTVTMRSADGTRTAELSTENRPGTDAAPGPIGTALPVTEEQMIEILLEPGLLI